MSRRYARHEKEKWIPSASLAPKRSPVRIPANNNDSLIAANKLTIIGRVTNPLLQRPRAVVDFLPQVWNLEGRVSGRNLGPEKFQLRFESEADLVSVLSKGPYHYKKWMLLIQRWEPVVQESFPSSISFWLRVHDLPLHFWDDQTLDIIGKEIGSVSGKNTEEARVRVDMNGLNPLTMNLEVRLPSDEVITVEFEYLKLEKHCFTCFSLLHEEVDCPHRPRHQLPPKNRKLGITQRIALHRIEIEKKRHDDRRGYTRYQPASRSNQAHNYEDRGRRANEIVYAHDTSSRTQRREGPSSAQQDRMDPLSTRRDMSYPQRMDHSRELSSGKIVSSREPHTIRDLSVGYTSKANDSQSSHTPPSRPIRERMDLPNEPSSERTLSTSRERRSALERIAEPDLRHTPLF